MADEAVVCAAAYFRSMGKDVTTTEEFVMGTSLEMKWMSPSESKLLLGLLLDEGILIQKGGFIRPAADLGGIDLPLAYRPSPEFRESVRSGSARKKETDAGRPEASPTGKPPRSAPDMFHVLMDAAVSAGMDRGGFVRDSIRIQKSLDIDIGVASLIAMRDAGLDISPYVDEVSENLQ